MAGEPQGNRPTGVKKLFPRQMRRLLPQGRESLHRKFPDGHENAGRGPEVEIRAVNIPQASSARNSPGSLRGGIFACFLPGRKIVSCGEQPEFFKLPLCKRFQPGSADYVNFIIKGLDGFYNLLL